MSRSDVFPALKVDLRRGEEAVMLVLTGELDLSTAEVLDSHLRAVEAGSPQVVIVDMRALSFLDSTGLASTLQAHQRAQENDRRFVVIPGPGNVQKVFGITGLDSVIEFRPAEEIEPLVESRDIA